jgi:hypothetical protein
MTIPGVPTAPASRARRILFTVTGGLVALAFLTATANVLAPWTGVNVEGLTDPGSVRWSLALEGIVDLLAVTCIVMAVMRPTRSALLVQYILLAAPLAAIVIVPFAGPSFLMVAALLLLVPLTYPYPRELMSLRSKPGPSMSLLAVACATAAVLVPLAVDALRTQVTLPRGSASDFNVLATNGEHLLLLALAGLLAATRRPGWRVLAGAVTAVYAYLGLASILLPNQPNSWGVIGGVASLAAACAYGITAVLATGRFSLASAQSTSTSSTAQRA